MKTAKRTAWLAALIIMVAASALEGQAMIRGVVYDSTTRSPVDGALIMVPGTSYSALTGTQGEFQLGVPRPGIVTLRVSHLAYGERTLTLDVAAAAPTVVRLALSQSAIMLEAVEVEVVLDENRVDRALGTRRSRVTREQILALESTTATLPDVLRQHMPNIRIRRMEQIMGAPICLELRTIRSLSTSGRECLSPVVYLDGVPVGNPTALFASLDIATIESLDVIPAAESGVRFGTGALYGALLIETRRPGGAEPPRVQGLRAYDWSSDSNTHPSSRAFGFSFAGNVAGLTIGYLIAHQCIGLRQPAKDAIITRCDTGPTAGAVIAALALPAIGGALGARLGGQTNRSRGMMVPAAVGALMAVVPGYALALTSERGNSDVLAVAAGGLLTVAVPFASTLADRLFRSVRN